MFQYSGKSDIDTKFGELRFYWDYIPQWDCYHSWDRQETLGM